MVVSLHCLCIRLAASVAMTIFKKQKDKSRRIMSKVKARRFRAMRREGGGIAKGGEGNVMGNSVVNISLDAKFLGLGVSSKWSRDSFGMISECHRNYNLAKWGVKVYSCVQGWNMRRWRTKKICKF